MVHLCGMVHTTEKIYKQKKEWGSHHCRDRLPGMTARDVTPPAYAPTLLLSTYTKLTRYPAMRPTLIIAILNFQLILSLILMLGGK